MVVVLGPKQGRLQSGSEILTMMLEWSPVISPVTLISIATAVVAAGGWIFKLGNRNREVEQFRADLDKLRSNLDQAIAATAGSVTLMREQHGELKEEIYKDYATKRELAAVETRLQKSLDEIKDDLKDVSGRIDQILAAVAK